MERRSRVDGTSGPVVLIEAALRFGDATLAGCEATAVLTGDPARGSRRLGELCAVEVNAARDAVNVMVVVVTAPARVAGESLALTLGQPRRSSLSSSHKPAF